VCHLELLGEWRQLDSDIELLLQTTHSVTSFNANDELKADILQSSFNSTPSNWVTGSAGSRDSCHVQLMSDNGGFLQQTPSSRQVSPTAGLNKLRKLIMCKNKTTTCATDSEEKGD